MYKYVQATWGCAIAFPILATISTLARFGARHAARAGIGADDILIVVSTMFIISASSLALVPTAQPEGHSQENVYRLNEATNVIGTLALGIIKVSILWLYKRIFVTRRMQVIVYLMTGIIIAIELGNIAAMTVLLPTRRLFGLNIVPVKFFQDVNTDYGVWSIVSDVIDITLDIIILILPVPFIRNLNLPRKKKFMVSSIFLLGAFCIIAPIVGLTYTVMEYRAYMDLIHQTPKGLGALQYDVNNWTVVGGNVSIVTANLITFGPLLRRIPSLKDLSRKSDGPSDKLADDSSTASREKARVSDDVRPTAGLQRAESRKWQHLWGDVGGGEDDQMPGSRGMMANNESLAQMEEGRQTGDRRT